MKDSVLETALRANGCFSMLSGAAMAAMPEQVARLIGLHEAWILWWIGILLLGYAGFLVWVASLRRPELLAMIASLGDFSWTAATIALGIFVPALFSPLGWGVVGTVAAIVLVFGLLQAVGIDRSYRHPESSRREWLRICLEFQLDVDSLAVWKILRDAGEIHRYSSSLQSSRIVETASDARTSVRECQDRQGRCWRETLVTDQEELRLEAVFLADRPGFPFPFRNMEGGWQVHPEAPGCRLQVWWDVIPRRRWAAFLTMPLLSFLLPRQFAQVVANMRAAALGQQPDTATLRPALFVGGC